MFDGIKLYCPYIEPKQWIFSPLLELPMLVSEKTGEILKQTRVSKYNGLYFKLIPSKIHNNLIYKEINGSLAKYYNNGKHNNYDYTQSNLKETIQNLISNFSLIPEQTEIKRLEFGVNIELPENITAKKVLKAVISHGNKRFADLNIQNVKLGRVCSRTDYDIKLYDKGKQAKTGETNILRVEIKIKRLRSLEPYGIKTLADLENKTKTIKLGQLLADRFGELIFYDNSIDKTQLTLHQQIKLLTWVNPMYWGGLHRNERKRQRQQLNNYMLQFSSSTLQKDIQKLIIKKWYYLHNDQTQKEYRNTQGNCIRFPQDKKIKLHTFSTVTKYGKCMLFQKQKTNLQTGYKIKKYYKIRPPPKRNKFLTLANNKITGKNNIENI